MESTQGVCLPVFTIDRRCLGVSLAQIIIRLGKVAVQDSEIAMTHQAGTVINGEVECIRIILSQGEITLDKLAGAFADKDCAGFVTFAVANEEAALGESEVGLVQLEELRGMDPGVEKGEEDCLVAQSTQI